MKIVFCGEDAFSVQVLESLISDNHQILAVFCPMYKDYRHARLQLICKNHNIDFFRVNDINSLENEIIIKALKPDLIAACHFRKLLKKNIIEIPLRGCINLHPSLLPNYRGLSPQHWPIINGDNETGISVHFINEGIDTGDVILQHKIDIEPDMYVSDLHIKMLKIYKHIFKDAIVLLAKNNSKPISQKAAEGSYYDALKKDHCNINGDGGYINAYNLIRGVSAPYFGARFDKYIIWRANLAPIELHEKIQTKYKKSGIYFDEIFGALIKFSDGSLIINKYNKINIV